MISLEKSYCVDEYSNSFEQKAFLIRIFEGFETLPKLCPNILPYLENLKGRSVSGNLFVRHKTDMISQTLVL